jgi:RNA recognition motif-containing protein
MNIYVGNLSYKASEEELRQAFAAYGQVSSVAIIKDAATGQSRGFAFVEMPNAPEGAAAITGLNGKEFKGRPLKINEARPREERPRREGGGGGGYGGGGGGYGGGGGGYGGGGGGGYGGGGDRGGGYGGDRGSDRGAPRRGSVGDRGGDRGNSGTPRRSW